MAENTPIHPVDRPWLMKMANTTLLREYRKQATQEGLPQTMASLMRGFNVNVTMRPANGNGISPLLNEGQPVFLLSDHNSMWASDILPACLSSLSRSDLKENLGIFAFPFGPPPDLANALDPAHDGRNLYVMHKGFNREISWLKMSSRDRFYRALYGSMFLSDKDRRDLNEQSFTKAGEILKSGGVVVDFPTGTSKESAFDKKVWQTGAIVGTIKKILPSLRDQVLVVPTYLEFEEGGKARPLTQADVVKIVADTVTAWLFGITPSRKTISMVIGRFQKISNFFDGQHLATKKLQEAFIESFSPTEKTEPEPLPEPALG